ncbi:MAG: fibronectin type III domain-containing protein, partial [Elusimicrobia bacterium]|nr:fibronectin type III domain-containing protein [Elusimicrobiota bacterium]
AAPSSLISYLKMDGGTLAAPYVVVSSDTHSNAGVATSGLAGQNCATVGIARADPSLGDCYVWQNAGDNIAISTSETLASTTQQLTLQAWIYPTALTSSPILEFNDATNIGVHLWQSVTSAGDLYANLVDTQAANHVVKSTGGFIHANSWQLVTLTYDGSVAKLFVGRVMIASQTLTSVFMQTSYPLYVGYRPSAGAVTYKGAIDEVRVYNAALPDVEIEGDPYGGTFFYKSTTTLTVGETPLPLTAGNYTGGMTFGQQTSDTVTVTGVALQNGNVNKVGFSFQDTVGNTVRMDTQLNVVTSAPDTPVSLSANPSSTQIAWSWTKGTRLCLQSGGGAGEFKGYKPADKSAVFTAQTANSYTQTGLSVNTLYGLSVSAVDAYGESGLSAPTSAYTQAAAPTTLAFTSVSTASVAVGWSANGNPGWTRYEVSTSLDNFATILSSPSQVSDDLTVTSRPLSGLSPQTTYYVRVRSFNGRADDTSTPGTTYSSFLQGSFETLPTAPSSLSGAAAGTSSITWTWSAVPTATSYTLTSSTGTNLAVTGATSVSVTNLSPNASYGAKLLVTNATGSGDYGPLVTTYTNPLPPTSTTATSVSTASALISWNANGNPVGTSFQVEVATNTDFLTKLQTRSATQDSIGITGLLPGSKYYARVKASGFNGSASAYDTAVSFQTGQFGAFSSTAAPAT